MRRVVAELGNPYTFIVSVFVVNGSTAPCLCTTMKVYSLSVILAPPNGTSTVLSAASDLSSFSFYQKGSVGEFMSFFSKTVAERTPQTQRQSVQENNYTAHVYNRGGAEQLVGMYLTWRQSISEVG
jgi:hypothetical protein